MLTNNAKAKRLLAINFIPAEISIKESADYLVKNA
jgi:hypothetical protein